MRARSARRPKIDGRDGSGRQSRRADEHAAIPLARVGRPADSVEKVYRAVKSLAMHYRFQPGARINEVDLARRLKVSRTPIREALNRLVQDGFLRFVPNRGFFARDLTPELVRDLYELRAAIEVAAVRLACARASDEGIAKVAAAWHAAAGRGATVELDRMAAADEAFHRGIARLSENEQIVSALDALNAQIKLLRRVDQESDERRRKTYGEHEQILTCLAKRDAARAADIMERHVVFSREHALAVTKELIARIFLSADGPPLSSSATAAKVRSKGTSTPRRPSKAGTR